MEIDNAERFAQSILAERKRQAAVIDSLIAALEPFCTLGEASFFARHEEDSTCTWRIKASDIRAARAAIAKARGEV